MNNICTKDINPCGVVRIEKVKTDGKDTGRSLIIGHNREFQDFWNTVIDLKYIMNCDPCLREKAIKQALPGIENGLHIYDICMNDHVILNHRIWLMYHAIDYRFRNNAVVCVTCCAAPGTYIDMRNAIYWKLGRYYDHMITSTERSTIDYNQIVWKSADGVNCILAEYLTEFKRILENGVRFIGE